MQKTKTPAGLRALPEAKAAKQLKESLKRMLFFYLMLKDCFRHGLTESKSIQIGTLMSVLDAKSIPGGFQKTKVRIRALGIHKTQTRTMIVYSFLSPSSAERFIARCAG